ncbi:MAG: cobyrinate a,c-diamide synthase [Acidobacteriota bacterium]|nr:cobyrinate a,c-diamide synthase [Acidobacteriota bacterium]
MKALFHAPRLIIAAPSSGSGKSTVATGLMAAFAQRLRVQGFKVGPDYIDPMYHTAATGRPSRNLDAWMLPPEAVRRAFSQAAADAQLSVIEGVMGFFDGADAEPLDGSTAQIAQLLEAPVILVVDCACMSVSAAAVVHGFHTFMPKVSIAGVICNRVGGERHAAWLREAIERYGVPVLGCLPRLPDLTIPERHLGLLTVAERPQAVEKFLAAAREAMARYLDLEALLRLAESAPPLTPDASDVGASSASIEWPPVRIGIARDEAFCFYYEDNLDALRRHGAETVFFSPLRDVMLPDDVSGLYFGGGYPELYAQYLSANAPMRAAVQAAHRQGMPIYAECGGLMYLAEAVDVDGRAWPMAGLLPGVCQMATCLTMGYREVALARDGLLGRAGQRLRGHEFHYSQWEGRPADRPAYEVLPRQAAETPRAEGFAQDNLHASYIHIHFGQDQGLAASFVAHCRLWRDRVQTVTRQSP